MNLYCGVDYIVLHKVIVVCFQVLIPICLVSDYKEITIKRQFSHMTK